MRKRKLYSTNSSKLMLPSQKSVAVGRPTVLAPCFDVVVVSAQPMSVAPIPEQFLVTAMRYDVIDHRCLGVPPQLCSCVNLTSVSTYLFPD